MNNKQSIYDYIRLRICPFNVIDELIKNNKFNKILEIGCGNGTFFRNFMVSKNFKEYFGTDKNIKSINKLNKFNNKNIKFCIEDIEQTINKVHLFDCILLVDVLHHINKKKQKKMIEEIIKNLKPNALLIYKDISNKNIFKGLINILHDLLFNFDLISYYEAKKIIEFVNTKKNYIVVQNFITKKYWYDHEFIIIKRID